jgi:hypothetical protein
MADDFLNNPDEQQGFPSELDTASPYTGNRPASGAKRATPGEVLSQGFQGAQNAGDFLGLDTEFAGSQDPNLAYGGAPLDLVPPPTTDTGGQYDPGYDPLAVPAPAPMPESDAVQDFAQAPSAFEFGEDLGSDEGEFAALEEPATSKKPMLVGALVLAALGAGGVVYGPTLYTRFFGSKAGAEPELAAQPKPPRGEKAPAAAPTSTVEAPLATLTPIPEPELFVPAPSVEPLSESPTPSVAPVRSFAPVASAEEDSLPSTSTAETEGAPEEIVTAGTLARPLSGSFPDLMGADYEWASADQLELIWRGSEVPLEAVRAPAKTIMPRVGNVRVFTTTGDVFDGRLFAVGQNRVWLDTEPGRVGLDGDQVERIEVLPPDPAGTQVNSNPTLAAGGKKVRVRVPGGMLYGHVLKTEGDDVTLALLDGGRVRVKASELQDLGPGRAVVVGR